MFKSKVKARRGQTLGKLWANFGQTLDECYDMF